MNPLTSWFHPGQITLLASPDPSVAQLIAADLVRRAASQDELMPGESIEITRPPAECLIISSTPEVYRPTDGVTVIPMYTASIRMRRWLITTVTESRYDLVMIDSLQTMHRAALAQVSGPMQTLRIVSAMVPRTAFVVLTTMNSHGSVVGASPTLVGGIASHLISVLPDIDFHNRYTVARFDLRTQRAIAKPLTCEVRDGSIHWLFARHMDLVVA